MPKGGQEVAESGSVHCAGDFESDENGGPIATSGYADYWADLQDRALVAWLPRLDQLLKMLGSPDDFLEKAACANNVRGAMFTYAYSLPTGPGIGDWHELALSVVMLEKYGKVWTGTEWRRT
jgi:hypothetical protein